MLIFGPLQFWMVTPFLCNIHFSFFNQQSRFLIGWIEQLFYCINFIYKPSSSGNTQRCLSSQQPFARSPRLLHRIFPLLNLSSILRIPISSCDKPSQLCFLENPTYNINVTYTYMHYIVLTIPLHGEEGTDRASGFQKRTLLQVKS